MPPIKSLEPETPRRLFTVKCVNASQRIYLGPCIVGSIIISSTTGVGLGKVYDGQNALAEQKYVLACIADTTFCTGAGEDRNFKNGIYVTVNDAQTCLMIAYYPLEV